MTENLENENLKMDERKIVYIDPKSSSPSFRPPVKYHIPSYIAEELDNMEDSE